MTRPSLSCSFPALTRRQARLLKRGLDGRPERLIEVAPYRLKNRVILTVYPEPRLASLADPLLYHLVLSAEAVRLLSPLIWEIPDHGSTTTPDAYLAFPWGEAVLEVDTGHYSPGVVKAKLLAFSPPLYWATPSPERLSWVQPLARRLRKEITPLLLPPLV